MSIRTLKIKLFVCIHIIISIYFISKNIVLIYNIYVYIYLSIFLQIYLDSRIYKLILISIYIYYVYILNVYDVLVYSIIVLCEYLCHYCNTDHILRNTATATNMNTYRNHS